MVLATEKQATRLISLNVNGLGSEMKRREIFRYLKSYKSDIVFLQETYASKEVEQIWSNEWGSKIYFSHGTTNARGVAFAVAKNFQEQIEGYWNDKDGRFIALFVKFEDKKVMFINIYAPNEDIPIFFTDIFAFLDNDNVEFDECIIGGDFNTTLNLQLDRRSDNPIDTHVKKRNIILEFLEQSEMFDIWRHLNQDKFEFSFRRLDPKVTMSRLDYFLLPQSLITQTKQCRLIPRYLTDHSMLLLDVNFKDSPRGPGYWKFNSSLLKDKDFLQFMNKLIDEYFDNVKKSGQLHTPDVLWEGLKALMVTHAKEFAIKKSQR